MTMIHDPLAPIADGDIYTNRLLREAPLFRAMVRAAECRLFSEIDLAEPVLDIGCGDGSFVQALAPEGRWAGIDPDRKPLLTARHVPQYSLVSVAAGGALPFPDNAFGSVVSNSTLEHILDVEPVLREMYRVLRPGGTFAVSFPSERFYDYHFGTMAASRLRVSSAADAYRAWIRRIARVHHADTPDVWRRRLEGVGLTVERWRYYFSRRNTAFMDITHYVSAPALVTHALLRRWVLWPGKVDVMPLARWLAPFTDPGREDDGSFLLFVCRK